MSTMKVDGKDLTIIEEVEICDGLTKKIIKHGEGESPEAGSMCVMHYTGCLATDDSKFDSSRDRNDPFEFEVGVGKVIQGWDSGVVTMKKGEECILCIRSDLGYGEMGAGGAIPPNADLVFHVELLDFFEKEKSLFEMNEEEKMTYAEDQKLKGNALLRDGDNTGAARCYENGLKAFDNTEVEELNPVYKTLKQSLHSNHCIVLLKSGNYLSAQLQARAVLAMDQFNIKATYNLINALEKDGDFEAALRESKFVLEREDLSESDRSMFQRQQQLTIVHRKQQDKKERAVYSKMFN